MRLEEKFPFGNAVTYHGNDENYKGRKLLPLKWDDEMDVVFVAVDGANQLDAWLASQDLQLAPVIPRSGSLAPPGGYVDGNPKTAAGSSKPKMTAIPGPALLALGLAMESGKIKYGLTNWREFAVTASTYLDAAARHLEEFKDGQTFDAESGIINLAHTMACCAIIIDAMAQGTITDDRTQFPGKTSELIKLISEGKDNALRIAR